MSLQEQKQLALPWITFGLISLAGAFLIAYSTTWGTIVYSDSTVYILSARSLLEGKGLGIAGPGGSFLPLAHYPPLYPLVLSGLGWLGVDLLDGARWLNVILFGLLIFLVSGGVYRFSRQFPLSVVLGLAFCVSPLFLEIYSRTMSEALFFLFMLVCLLLLIEYLKQPYRKLLVGAGMAAGLACLTRYPGVTLVICGGLLLFIFPRTNWKKRLLNQGIFFGLAGGLAATWLLPLFLRTQRLAARTLQPAEDLAVALREARVSLIDLGWSWLPFSSAWEPTPSYALRGWFLIALVMTLGVIALVSAWRRLRAPERSNFEPGMLQMACVFALFSVVYLVFIAFSFLFSSPRNDLDGRLLSPVYLSVVLTVFPLLAWVVSGGKPGRRVSWIPAFLVIFLAAGGLGGSLEFVQKNHRSGAGYTSKVWQDSATLQAVKRLDPAVTVISNEGAAILFLADRPAYEINEFFLSAGSEDVPVFGSDPEDPAQRLFREGKAVLVIFTDYFYWQLFPIYGDRTQQVIDTFFQNMQAETRLTDGVIFRYAKP
jgi:hypothetical protein